MAIMSLDKVTGAERTTRLSGWWWCTLQSSHVTKVGFVVVFGGWGSKYGSRAKRSHTPVLSVCLIPHRQEQKGQGGGVRRTKKPGSPNRTYCSVMVDV